ncbi:MAG: hypothetical protein U0531_15050 [Dehalococcoidia bacterium]
MRARGLDTPTVLRAAARLTEKTGALRDHLRAALSDQERAHAVNAGRLDAAAKAQEAQHREVEGREGALLTGARTLQQNVFQVREFFGIAAPAEPVAPAAPPAAEADHGGREERRGGLGGLLRGVGGLADALRDAAIGLVADEVVEDTERSARRAAPSPPPAAYHDDHPDVVAVNDIAALTVAFKRDEVLAMLGLTADAVAERLARGYAIAQAQIAQSDAVVRQEAESYAQFTAKLTAATAKINDQLAAARADSEARLATLDALDAQAREVQAFFRP